MSYPQRPGPPNASQRDAAFANIFGTAPPPRSQTMTSQQPMPQPPRSQTMSSDTSTGMRRPNGYPPQTQSQTQAQDYPPAQQFRQMPPPPPIQQQPPMRQYGPPQGQNYPPMNPPRNGYPQPMRGPPPPNPAMSRPPPHRYYAPAPALNADPYRSRSMAAMPSYQHNPQPPLPNASHPFRNPQPPRPLAQTTASGRIVPGRPDERSMSMTTYSHSGDYGQSQTMGSGRIIPHRRRPSEEAPQAFQNFTQGAHVSSPTAYSQRHDSMNSNTTTATVNGRSDSPTANSAAPKQRTVSTTSTSSSIAAFASPTETPHRQSLPKNNSGSSTVQSMLTATRRAPLVYPALLGKVAETFRDRLATGDRTKNDLVFKNAFTGAEAVDLISYIIKTSDRNLALLLGRALDAQKFFHDVTYEHRLRDSGAEVYQFKERIPEDNAEQTNGVFTLLTECYSPTCTRDRLCYSIACPRRLEQQARLNMKPQPGLKRVESRSSLHGDDEKEQKLWIHSVSKEIAESVDEKEKRRQEVIMEAIYTERDFVKDLEYLRDFWMKPLRGFHPSVMSPIPENRREKFVRSVFTNVLEVHAVNCRLAEALTRRQQSQAVVHAIGDIFLEYVPRFEPFIKYGAHQLMAKYDFEREKSSNPPFARFVEETERMKESRKLELNGYLTKPTTRLARYPLLLEAVLKVTAEGNPDRDDLPKAIEMIREFLSRVNIESGKAENHFNLLQLSQNLVWRPGEQVDLKLMEEGRQLLFKGTLKKSLTDNAGDIQAFLFDHALLLVRVKAVNKREQYKVYRKPIPLELLIITQSDEVAPKAGIAKRPSSSLIPGAKSNLNNKAADISGKGFPITFVHLGRRGGFTTLFASTFVGRRKWIEHIETQQAVLRERSAVFTKTILCENYFSMNNSVNCLVPTDGGRKLIIGTDNGVYITDRKPKEGVKSIPRKALDLNKVEQVDVLEEYSMLLALSEKSVLSFPVEFLESSNDQLNNSKRHKKIMGHTNFFKAGVCLGKVLVCCAKSTTMSSTIKVLEPLDTLNRNKKQPTIRKFLAGGQETLKPFKVGAAIGSSPTKHIDPLEQVPDLTIFQEFYIPSESFSIHFLKSKLCVGCAKGFEVVSLETLETQSLLDPADTSLDFVNRKEGVVKPIAIYRLNGEFLLNYSDFSFFVNKNGWRARPDWHITWEGQPQSFALSYPYILAFEPSFIEIRNLETGGPVHIITGNKIRMLHESTREILYAYEEEDGHDTIASLDFWSRNAPR